jgi:opacity protein-like surface antigen
MFTALTPDYGVQPNAGYTVGGDFTKIFKFTALSLEFRFKDADGPTVRETTTGGGPRFEYRWTRLHLYADLIASVGTIDFADKNARGSNGTGANGSVVYTYGAGVDYDLTGQWAVQFDYQSEHWDLEEKPKILLFPNAFSVGIVYHLRFPKDRSRW